MSILYTKFHKSFHSCLKEIYDGSPVLTDSHVAEANFQVGNNQGELYKIGILTSGARGLLVAMTCYGISDTFVKPGAKVKDVGALPMDISQIRGSFATLIDVKKQCGGIVIGHECTETNIRRWVSELHDCGLIKGGPSTLGGARSFAGGKSEKVKRAQSNMSEVCQLFIPAIESSL